MTPENERDTPDAGSGVHIDDVAESGARAGEPATDAPREADTRGASDARGEGGTSEGGTSEGGTSDGGGANGAAPDDAEPAGNEAVDAGATGEEATGEDAPLEDRLAAAEAQAAAHWDRLVRLQAEMENQRKRAQRDVSNSRKFALESIAQDLLPVKDSLELGLAAANAEEADIASLRQGSELTLKMLAQVLEKHAIVEIDPQGEKFDPEFHQAMSMQEVEGVAPNTVTGVMQKGYTLNDRLIRPALVMVSK